MIKTKGQKIKELRKTQGLSQTDLALEMEIKNQTLSKYENDIVTNIPSDKIELICKFLNTTPSYIMGWQEEPVVQDFRTTGPISPTLMSVTSKDEQELIQNFNQLNGEGKERLLENSREYTELSKYKKDSQFELGKKQA